MVKKSSPKPASPHTLLAPYRAKRDFKKTAEPSGTESSKAKKAAAPIFMIQKHAATRLHYDFRLELDGVLKSWAVTRGPSLNPADKRLSVHVEDHPVSYATFEGSIPKGEYGGGTVMLWDRGTWEAVTDPHEGYAGGNLKFILHGERLKGEWHLVRMHGHRKEDMKHDNWLLMKTKDDYANEHGEKAVETYTTSVASKRSMEQLAEFGDVYGQKPKKSAPKAEKPKAKAAAPKKTVKTTSLMPEFVEPQLATLVDRPPEGKQWGHEIKFDGYRVIARLENGEVRLFTRNRQEWTPRFQAVADELAKLKVTDAMIDGEIVVHNKDGTSSFSALQESLKAERSSDMHYYAFDLLFLNGEDLRSRPLKDRKAALQALLPKAQSPLHYSEDFTENGATVYQHACQIALEGIISKRLDLAYQPGRSAAWVKSKCLHEQEFVIGGYTEQPKHIDRLGALLIGYYKDGKLQFSGKVGTGFTQAIAADLMKKLTKLKQKENPFGTVPGPYRRGANWVKPMLVGQVRFTEWTDAGSLRHPAFLGLREDKKATDVVREMEKEVTEVVAKKTPAEPAIPPKAKSKDPTIADVTLSHPDKLLFEPDVTKRMLAEYYEAVAEWMLPHVAGRPISLLRCPSGGKGCFFQRHAGEGASEFLHQVKVIGGHDQEPYIVIDDLSGLIALAQIGTLEIHAWGTLAAKGDKPDRITFDFDPDEGLDFKRVKQAAVEVKERLESLGLQSFLKVTGGKGLHVVAPINPGPSWEQVHDFTQTLARQMEADSPQRFTSNIRKVNRKGKILIDYFRNAHSASSVAAYSTRAKPHAPIALPIEWGQLAKLQSPSQFILKDVPKLLAKRKSDPWTGMLTLKQKLPK